MFRDATAAAREAVSTLARRAVRGAEQPSWGLRDELVLAALRAAFAGAADRPLEVLRRQFDRIGVVELLRRRVRCRRTQLDDVQAEWVLPHAGGRDTVFFLHGGGYVFGSTRSHRVLMADLANAAGVRVVGIDYRLAPEHPAPAALEDVATAWRRLLASGLDPARTVWVGDSAGGGLVIAGMVAALAAGEPLPAAAAVISPWVDLTCSGRSHSHNAHSDYIAAPHRIPEFARACAGSLPLDDPRLSPALHPLPRLPPLFIQVGSAEILLDDARRLARVTRLSGTPTTLQITPGGVHVWHALSLALPSSRAAVESLAGWLREQLPVPRSRVRDARDGSGGARSAWPGVG